MKNYKEEYKSAIGDYLNLKADEIFLFWKGRVALYAILKALGIKKNDEVIVPAFTCVVVPNVIIYLGAKPIYTDIDPRAFNINVNQIETKITSKTKAIIAQNTFGLAPDLNTIFKIAEKYNLKVIEDCTHGFGGMYNGKKNGTIADASFFSTQWNKPFSTGIGGIAVVKDKDIIEVISVIEKNLIKPSFREMAILKLLLSVKKRFVIPALYWEAIKLYRFLSTHNLIIGSSQGNELKEPIEPKNFLKGMSSIQAEKGIEEILKVDKYNIHRVNLAKKYDVLLTELKLEIPFKPEYAKHTFLKYPIFVKDRKRFFDIAERNKIEIGDWFMSPLHPIENNFKNWNYDYGSNPVAEKISKHIVNLPTHYGINDKCFEKIKLFLLANADMLTNNSAL